MIFQLYFLQGFALIQIVIKEVIFSVLKAAHLNLKSRSLQLIIKIHQLDSIPTAFSNFLFLHSDQSYIIRIQDWLTYPLNEQDRPLINVFFPYSFTRLRL